MHVASILSPMGSAWDYFFECVEVYNDFITERNQPMPQERESIFDDDFDYLGLENFLTDFP